MWRFPKLELVERCKLKAVVVKRCWMEELRIAFVQLNMVNGRCQFL